jgi:hypothetical protein
LDGKVLPRQPNPKVLQIFALQIENLHLKVCDWYRSLTCGSKRLARLKSVHVWQLAYILLIADNKAASILRIATPAILVGWFVLDHSRLGALLIAKVGSDFTCLHACQESLALPLELDRLEFAITFIFGLLCFVIILCSFSTFDKLLINLVWLVIHFRITVHHGGRFIDSDKSFPYMGLPLEQMLPWVTWKLLWGLATFHEFVILGHLVWVLAITGLLSLNLNPFLKVHLTFNLFWLL